MVSIRWRSQLLGLILLACGQPAFGGVYTDPSGFSFTYPEGWMPLTRAAMGDVNQAIPPEMKEVISKNNVDLNRIAVALFRVGNEEFLENLNVVVINDKIPVNDNTVAKMTTMLGQEYAKMGVKVDNIQGRVQKVGNSVAVVLEYQSRMPGVPDTLRQQQVFFPGSGKTYIVTCTAKADSFAKYQSTFDGVLASFDAPGTSGPNSVWTEVLAMAVVGGVLGGSIGVLIWLRKKSANQAKPKRDNNSPFDSETY